MKSLRLLFILTCLAQLLCCCTMKSGLNDDSSPRIYTIYVINRNIHTGLIIPVNELSKSSITALKYFENASYIDFGWGEEVVYQAPVETVSMDLKAIMIPSSSVLCVRGLNLDIKYMVSWCDYAVEFRLTEDEFRKICRFVDNSFSRDQDNSLIQTSVRSGGDIIYFKSVHTYCLFNTCNTWIADALSQSVAGISPVMVITKYGLYDEIAEKGIILKKSTGKRSWY